MSIEVINQLSYDTVIPSVMLIDEKLELNAVKLYAFIKNLTRAHGYCFATNQYLADLMRAEIRSVQRWLVMLKEEGYLEIETQKNGIHWQRRIYISDKFKKVLRKDTEVIPPRNESHTPMTFVSPITKDYINEDNKKREEAAPPPSPLFSHKRVKMDQSKYQNLVNEYGLEKIKIFIDRLDEYADINPKRFKQYACHAAVVRKWIREDKEKGHPPRVDNEKYAEELCKKLNHPMVQFYRGKCLIIQTGGSSASLEFKFTENGFKEQVLNRLRKMELITPGMEL